jgi:VWFA-related protein
MHFAVVLAAAALVAVTAGGSIRAAQTPAASPAPTDPDLVRLDVYPTASGMPVTDLRATEFEVLEDDVPQKIESFEHVMVGPTPSPGGRSRTFVVFLDTYFTNVASSREVRGSLAALLDRIVGPDDLIGIMTPDMAASDMTLVHRTESAEEMLSKYWFWGRDLEAIDPVEEQYLQCYPHEDRDSSRARTAGFGDEMIQRRREKRVIGALRDLAKHLSDTGAGRKAVITVTDGWVLFQPNMAMTERTGGGAGRLERYVMRRAGRPDEPAQAAPGPSQQCDQDRVSLSLVDDRAAFDSLGDSANRGTISFYPITTQGLRAFAPAGASSAETPAPDGEVAEAKRVESLRSLATNTDGLAMIASSDVEAALHRIVDDLSAYYLLSYRTTNPTPDGKFRTIHVRSTRPGVDVRTRRGYRVPKLQDEEPAPLSGKRTAPKTPLDAALATLKADKPNLPLRIGAAFAPLGLPESSSTRFHMWAMAEIDPTIARNGEWVGGGKIDVSVTAKNGETLAQHSVTFAGGEHSASIDLGEVASADDELVVHASARAAGSGRQNYSEALQLDSLAWPGRPLVFRRGPATAMRYVPTAAFDFERTEHIRIDLPLASTPDGPTAELLDRLGRAMTIPVSVASRSEGKVTWLSAEVTLAPLAEGTYLVRLKPDKAHADGVVISGFRIVP